MASRGEKEWYFFSPRDRKYPKGSRPNRAAGSGYWKATGADKPVGKPKTLGIKKALVFYAGKAPHGIKTNWIMHEYRLANVDRSPPNTNNNLRLDDWVLCRIYNKKGTVLNSDAAQTSSFGEVEQDEKLLTVSQNNEVIAPSSMPHFHDDRLVTTTNSSSTSDHLHVSSEVQSAPKWNDHLLDFHLNYLDGDNPFGSQILQQHNCNTDHFNPFHDMFL